jgi:UDP-N-acetylglucosamine 2-epimerase (non-hydrolysing)
MRVAVVLGTRPEIIKLAGVIDGLGDAVSVIHTGQHYDEGLSQVFLDGLGVPAPARVFDLGGLTRAEQIGRGTELVAAALEELKPAAVVVQGDTNSALAGGLAANATGYPLVHVEAGLRSFDKAMPEEHNRVLVDHLSDLLAAPTAVAVANLQREGISGELVIQTGNTVVEAVRRQVPDAVARARLLAEYGVPPAGFALATIHRPENTDDPAVLAAVLGQLGALPLPVVFPAHPRTIGAAIAAGLDRLLEPLRVVAPLDGPTFLGLAAESAVLVSDSGGVQEEVTVLGRPLVVVRRSTERPEAFEHHATLVDPDGIAAAAGRYLADLPEVHRRLAALPSPYGDGTASERIVAAIRSRYDSTA